MVSETNIFNVSDNGRNVKDAPEDIRNWSTVEDIDELIESDMIYDYRETLASWGGNPYDDASIGLRGELNGEEYYSLVRIFNIHFLTMTERSLIEDKIHGPFPNSNVYFYEHHETEEIGVEFPNYCHSVSSEMDVRAISLEAAALIKVMEDNRHVMEDNKPDYYDIIWVIKPEE